ncbi:hypothetical protein HDU98_004737 [Podochytrium sp. JEL0797]|nr:hypothetical protein HDU98_004737 [Podochytrium sp. JEL0797]
MAMLSQISQNHTRMQSQLNQLAATVVSHQERIESTSARFDSLEAKANVSKFDLQSSIQSSVTSVYTSITQNHRQLSLQILQLQNATKKYYTRFTALPPEVITLILSWIHPTKLWKLRRVCRSFKNIISAKSLALINILRFLPAPDPTILES